MNRYLTGLVVGLLTVLAGPLAFTLTYGALAVSS